MKQTLTDITTILLDIEGTICPISFVKETLFPYAINALPEVLAQKWDDPEFATYRDAFPDEARSSPKALEEHVRDLTRRDVKIAYLKNLQGYLWQSGYESQAYSTPLFSDVIPALQSWHSQSPPLSINIYSSGSIFAQKLLFAHVRVQTSASSPSTSDGTTTTLKTADYNPLLTHYFDTVTAGPKTVASSYLTIASALPTFPSNILFLSDNVAEIQAALDAGMKAVVVERPGNAELSQRERDVYDVVGGFEKVSEGLLQIDGEGVGGEVA